MPIRPKTLVLLLLCSLLVGACRKPTDFTGFWKGTCTDAFGLQIKQQSGNLFSISFCGPGGCSAAGEWTANTPISGDPKYRVIDATTIEKLRPDGAWDRWRRCTLDTNPVLTYATMPTPSQELPDQANESPGAGQHTGDWKGADKSVYVVTQNHYAEGFVPEGQTAMFGDLIAIHIWNPESSASAYETGERLRLFMGAEQQGYITIQREVPFQCDTSAALASANSSVRFTKDTMALASNADTIRPHTNNRRQPTAQERSYAQQLAAKEFKSHDVGEISARSIKLDHLIVTKLDGIDTNFLIGSVSVRLRDVSHELFLIGKIQDSTATTELVQYHMTTDLIDGTDSEDFRFVEQLDLDGDGTDEIVVEVTGYESEQFRIYSRQDGVWNQVHVGGEGGC